MCSKDVFTSEQLVVICLFPVSLENIRPSGRIFNNCQRFKLSGQISDIFLRIHPIEISTDDILEIMPMRSDLFSYLDKVKPMCKQIQLHVSAHNCRVLTDRVNNCIFQHFAEVLRSAPIISVGNLLFTPPNFTQVIQKTLNTMILFHMGDRMTSHFFAHIISYIIIISYKTRARPLFLLLSISICILDGDKCDFDM